MTETEHLLTILAEECAEVAQRCSKALRFGLCEIQPGQDATNAQRITAELSDLWAVTELLVECGALMPPLSIPAIEEKKLKVQHFLKYSKQCGTLQNR